MTPTIATNSVVLNACFVSSFVRRAALGAALVRSRSADSVAAIRDPPHGSYLGGGLRPILSRCAVTQPTRMPRRHLRRRNRLESPAVPGVGHDLSGPFRSPGNPGDEVSRRVTGSC